MPESDVGTTERALAVGDSIVFVYEPRERAFELRGNDIEILAVGADVGVDVASRRVSIDGFVARARPEHADALVEALERASGSGDAFDVELAFGDGPTPTWLSVRGRGLDGDTHRPARVVGTMRDVTAYQRLQAEHRELVRTTQAILQTSSDVISIIDQDGVIREIGTAATRVLDADPDSLVGSTVFASPVVHPDDRATVADVYRRLLSGEIEHEESRYRVQTAGADLRVVEGHRRVLRSPDGDVDGVVVIVSDVTDNVRLETDLRAARAAAERADRSKDDFLSRLSHEMRTPLNAVIGFGRLLTRDDLGAEQHESVEQIVKAGQILLELTNAMLDISRATSGRLTVATEPVTLPDAISAAVRAAESVATPAGVTVSVALDDPLSVLADRARFQQVLHTLLSNATLYNREGGSVEITTAALDGGRVQVRVRDTGIGIGADDLERVFEPFVRLGAERTDVEGTGLGLALAKALVEAMHGSIAVESTQGVGSVFTVELPQAGAPAQRAVPHTSSNGMSATPASGGHTVLYVEDNESNRRLVERILARHEQYTLLLATDGRMGLRMAREQRPTIILLDLHLPDINGDEVLLRLREAPETRATPVLMLSADATPAQVERLLETGATDYMTKPLDIEKFLETLERLCSVRA